MPSDPPSTGYTVPDLSRLLRVGEDKIRMWIKRGELSAINTSSTRCGRPRFVVLADSLQRFLDGRNAAEAPLLKPARRKKQTNFVDYFPD